MEVAQSGGRGRVLYELGNLLTGREQAMEKVLKPMLLSSGTIYARFVSECRQYRLKAGLTVNELAVKADVPAGTIRRIEKLDIRWIRFAQLRRLAAAINWYAD